MLVYHNISYCSFITIFHINGHAKCTLIAKPRYQTVHNWRLVHLELASFASTNCVLSFKILQVSNQNLNDIHVFLTARCCKYVESTCKVWRRFYQLSKYVYINRKSARDVSCCVSALRASTVDIQCRKENNLLVECYGCVVMSKYLCNLMELPCSRTKISHFNL